ncbi:MAG: GntR family transcriptional regulator [Proteobacteria bacterium]|nr:GntR family transcriptional regulator [Pseudomonadota bacterium]MBU1585429.1 GntR family transcriptional regulator [Pseudomonadota bacterium]MBU2454648.1 GntR family transcriptional regulator [Pseudomonadota bacterium]MBU2629229.1 GntR family transcriptional regulator [Pseudomonadota bacterium]
MADSLEDLAYNKIKVAISKGYIKKGSKLKEVSLAKSLAMSRATVKGAVKRLVFEGLAEFSPNKGTSVVNPTLEEIKATFQVRAQLEKMAATLAAENLGLKDYKEIHKLIQKEKDVFKARELDQYYEINNAIHLKIAQKSGNRILVHYVKELLQKTTIFLILFDPFYQLIEVNNTSPAEHERIVQWLEEKNGDQAGLAMEQHLESAMSGIDVKRLFPDDYLTV